MVEQVSAMVIIKMNFRTRESIPLLGGVRGGFFSEIISENHFGNDNPHWAVIV
jgi:hypothetical protein